MGISDDLNQAQITIFERGIRQPSLPILAAYAKAANLYIEALITDDAMMSIFHIGCLTSQKAKGIGEGGSNKSVELTAA